MIQQLEDWSEGWQDIYLGSFHCPLELSYFCIIESSEKRVYRVWSHIHVSERSPENGHSDVFSSITRSLFSIAIRIRFRAKLVLHYAIKFIYSYICIFIFISYIRMYIISWFIIYKSFHDNSNDLSCTLVSHNLISLHTKYDYTGYNLFIQIKIW